MNKLKKNALKSGTGGNNYYICSSCGRENALSASRCKFCKAIKPGAQEAFDSNYGYTDRTVKNAYPTPTNPCFAHPLQKNVGFVEQSSNFANLPDYYSTDEYGRVFKTNVTYGALPCSAPVPVPTPSKVVQVAPLNVPLNIPNNTNY